jgi:hypothetical protein
VKLPLQVAGVSRQGNPAALNGFLGIEPLDKVIIKHLGHQQADLITCGKSYDGTKYYWLYCHPDTTTGKPGAYACCANKGGTYPNIKVDANGDCNCP